MPTTLRLATPDDAAAILGIYAPYVRDTVISFEYEVPAVEEIRRRIENVLAMYPWLLAERDGTALGYAYATRFHPRAAFQWTVETSIYLAPAAHRQGIGTQLYSHLLQQLREQGLCTVIAAITLPNPTSIAFHEALGFHHTRTHHDIGYKHGQWHSIGYWRHQLAALPPNPAPPIPHHQLTP